MYRRDFQTGLPFALLGGQGVTPGPREQGASSPAQSQEEDKQQIQLERPKVVPPTPTL